MATTACSLTLVRDYSILGCDAVSQGKQFLKFCRVMEPSSSGISSPKKEQILHQR